MTKANANQQSPWHEGERQLQEKFGVSEKMDTVGAIAIRSHMPSQHREFFTQLPFIAAGSVDDNGDPWATVIPGQPGFISSPADTELEIAAALDPNDPMAASAKSGSSIGLLGIELHTRRRNRMNGHISKMTSHGFNVSVEHSFGNCPQYIQMRDYTFVRKADTFTTEPVQVSESLTDKLRERITKADTFFVTSFADLNDGRQVDISHRGGKPGFVKVDNSGVLTIPDYAGNLFFNTLGNIFSNPKAALVFPDFETGDLLHMTGTAEIIFDSEELDAFEGAERLWTFKPNKVLHRPDALPIRWSFKEYSPNVLLTGSWEETSNRIEAERERMTFRSFEVTKIVDESSVIKSFWLEPKDGKGFVRHEAGQHLPVRLNLPASSEPTLRTYTLSLAPSDSAYRISIKKDGLFSTHMHEQVSVGDEIEVRAPQGNFTIDSEESRPVVMLGAGVGITPFTAMLRHLVHEGLRTRTMRPAWLFQAARTADERGFDKEFEKLLQQSGGQLHMVRLLDETDEPENPQKGIKGRLSIDLLKGVLPFDDYDFYLCGPPPFMEALYNDLRDMNIPDKRIFFEAFGPASVKRRPDGGVPASDIANVPVEVSFSASGKSSTWQPDAGSLLELAEKADLSPPFSCRMGSCGSCKTTVIDGKVAYDTQPNFPLAENEALICCGYPATSKDGNINKLVLNL